MEKKIINLVLLIKKSYMYRMDCFKCIFYEPINEQDRQRALTRPVSIGKDDN